LKPRNGVISACSRTLQLSSKLWTLLKQKQLAVYVRVFVQ